MLKTTQIELQLITSIDIYSFIKKGIRGGIVQCSNRYSIANNKYMSNYDDHKPSKYLMYLDANNLYGWAMSEYLPYAEFEWLDNVNDFDVFTIEENSSYGFILEVDLEYPHSIHDIHNDLPFCCENKKIGSMIQPKLITDLNNKTRYVIHYRNLQQCLKHGLKLKKVHRVLRFKQSNWLKKYIDLNTFQRTNAKNDFEKNFFKLLNNAVYGKTMENVDKKKDIKIVCEWESIGKRLGARALIAKPNFHSYTSFTENMLAIQLKRSCTLYDKPICIGFVVLELSKWKMYNFHYSYMKPKFQTKLCLNYMDTDSFIYTIQTNDFYKDIHDDIDLKFDTSEYLDVMITRGQANKATLSSDADGSSSDSEASVTAVNIEAQNITMQPEATIGNDAIASLVANITSLQESVQELRNETSRGQSEV
ncbi:PREDICTED: uncharacterized protein LOC108358151 [Rhagoletis zephyria]|uniref:uncharacterized protein LOC108358151 n=1 Tax=Rhagoletis zephyria TaxID=28612 RepID=UPI0008112B99|nr:PREDICTED: uncharacterized protein LOC108358151 [Rhagoletis zephyria]